jgi:tetratricopeptide (TPR) repeat protein
MTNTQNKQSKKADTMLHLNLVAASEDVYMSQNALHQIAILHISDKRYAEAHQVLSKAEDVDIKSKRVTYLKDLVEAIIYLAKSKVKKAVQILSDLIELLKDTDQLMTQALNFRVYGYVAIEKYEQAIKDIKMIKKMGPVETESLYN